MSDAALTEVLRRDRTVIIAAVAIITALAWAYIIWLSRSMDATPMSDMPGMGSDIAGMGAMAAPAFRSLLLVDFIFVFAMWTAMMVGMMTPSAAPMILLYARVGRQAAQRGRPFAAVSWFTAGYLLAWTGFSLLAMVGQWALTRAALLTPMMQSATGIFGGSILIAAGIYQWTPLKDICLRHCQTPLIFLQRHGGFRRDNAGSLGLGFRHGLYCVGCCWALMALLFVGGVMNVLWIAGLSIFVLAEKILPLGSLLSRSAGAGLIVIGVWLITGQ